MEQTKKRKKRWTQVATTSVSVALHPPISVTRGTGEYPPGSPINQPKGPIELIPDLMKRRARGTSLLLVRDQLKMLVELIDWRPWYPPTPSFQGYIYGPSASSNQHRTTSLQPNRWNVRLNAELVYELGHRQSANQSL
jgi:hypothetical protein